MTWLISIWRPSRTCLEAKDRQADLERIRFEVGVLRRYQGFARLVSYPPPRFAILDIIRNQDIRWFFPQFLGKNP